VVVQIIMKCFILVCLLAVVCAEDALRAVLSSPKATLGLYNDFKAKQHVSYSSSEDRLRFRLFRNTAKFVAQENELNDGADYELNMFASMTPQERQSYLGLNITGHLPNSMGRLTLPAGFQAPVSKLWMNEGAVTKVKNQGSCGSCWTFGAVGSVETFYAQQAGVLRAFAEQEYLDCVYPSRDGCQGGWPSDCFKYSQKNQRLAALADYPYKAKDTSCKGSSTANGLISASIDGFKDVSPTEDANIQALTLGSLAVAFEVTNKFQQYKRGILKDTTCRGRPNHAVTAVGYTANYVLVKNSWGATWGDHGYVKFSRNYGNCGLFKYSSYPVMKSTGAKDSKPADAATVYVPTDDDTTPTSGPKPDPDCEDKAINCTADFCKWSDIASKWCRKTCGKCDGGDDKDCPSGTKRCDDGVCRHEHMCH